MLVLVVSLGVWASGEVVALRLILGADLSAEAVFTALVGVIWTAGGLLAVYALAWNLRGREIVTADPASLSVSRCLARWCRTRSYPLSEIANLRVESEEGGWLGAYWWMFGIKAGMVAFEYGSSTVRFGDRLDEPTAGDLVRTVENLRSGGVEETSGTRDVANAAS